MDGVFMEKIIRRLLFLAVIVGCFYWGGFLADREALRDELTGRCAAADVQQAENYPEQMRPWDGLLASLRQAVADASDMQQAGSYIHAHLPRIREAAQDMFRQLDSEDIVADLFREEVWSASFAETEKYRIRFYFAELLDKVEKFFFGE